MADCVLLPVARATPVSPRFGRSLGVWMGSAIFIATGIGTSGETGGCWCLTCGSPVVDSAVRTGRKQGPRCTAHEAALPASQEVTGTCCAFCRQGSGTCAPRRRVDPSPTRSKNFGEKLEAAIDGIARGPWDKFGKFCVELSHTSSVYPQFLPFPPKPKPGFRLQSQSPSTSRSHRSSGPIPSPALTRLFLPDIRFPLCSHHQLNSSSRAGSIPGSKPPIPFPFSIFHVL